MIIVKFQGGLGNQISQYAFCRRLQHYYPEAVIKADLDFYIYNHDHQGFELDKVFAGILLERASVKDILKVTGKISASVYSTKRCCRRAIRGINRFLPTKDENRLRQNTITKYPEENIYWNLDLKQDWYLDGYWHSYNYNEIMDELREELNFVRLIDEKNKSCERRILEDENSVSIHIRRGDYVDSIYDIVDVDYYSRAVQIINSQISDPKFYLFSDEIGDAEKLLNEIGGLRKVECVSWNSAKNSYYDMYLMSLCKHNIIANSTFSYWAAQLNKNKNKIVIWPKLQTTERESWDVEGWVKI